MKRKKSILSENGELKNSIHNKSKEAISWLSSLNIPTATSEKIWQSIEKRLENLDKRVLSWFMAMTTTFTLLVAAGLEYGEDIQWLSPLPSIEIPNEISTTTANIPAKKAASSPANLGRTLQNVQPKLVSHMIIKKVEIPSDGIQKITREIPGTRTEQKIHFSPGISARGELNYSNKQLLPGIGLNLRVFEIQGTKANHSMYLGWTSYFASIPVNESTDTDMTLMNYVKLGYGYTHRANKGWHAETGYLINPDGVMYDESTIKLSIHRKMNKHIRFGPEIIFTKGFTEAIPSFSVLFNS